MSSSFALWLVGILTVVTGLVIWRVLTVGRTTAEPAASIMEDGPATVTGDQERPAAVVDEVPPPAAVTEEPVAAPAGTTPATVEEIAPPAGDTAEPAESAPALAEQPAAEAEPAAVEAEPAAVEAEPAAVEAEPVTTATEPVAAETEPVAADTEPVAADVQPATPVTIPAPRTSVENATAAEPAAAPVAAPADQAADDFRRIQGIGPKMAAALEAAGIRTYQQLAELDEAGLRETIKAAGLRAAPSVATWPQQAKVLAAARAEAEAVLP